MSEKSQTYDSELFKQDLSVYTKAIKRKDFKTANIISNRIMTNAWLSDAQFYGVTGFFLRQLSLDALISSNVDNPDAVKTNIDQTEKFVDTVLGQASSEKNSLKELWISFTVAIEKTRKTMLLDDERTSYEDNVEYTSATIHKVTKLLLTSREDLISASNNFIKGILNEIGRVSRIYGIKQTDLYLFSLLVMIDRIDEYVGTTALDKDDFENRIKKEVLPLIDQLNEVFSKDMNEDLVNKLMWDLIKNWRLYYVRFMEPRKTSIQQSKQPIIEGKIKDELVDELAEGIEKEVISE